MGVRTATCEHLDRAPLEAEAQTTEGCQECLQIPFYDWVHLRKCLECGHIGCCDSSPYRHATVHYHDTQHPVMRSFETGESWRWCYIDEIVA
jgi:uncharacterized UBP type Zn finger protein